MFYPLTVRDFLDRAEHVYPDRVAVVDEPDQPAPSLGELTYREMAANARAQAAKLDELGVPRGRPGRGRLAQLGAAAHLVLRRVRLGTRPGAGQLPAVPARDRLHRPALRRLGRLRGRVWRTCWTRSTSSTSSSSATTTTSSCRDTRTAGVGRSGRERDRHDQLHVRNDRPTQGRSADPPQSVAQRDRVRAAHDDQRPRRLPPHAPDVPRERLGHAVRHHRRRRPAHRAAPGRRRRDPATRRAARRHPDVRGAGRRQRRARRGGRLGRRDPRPRPGPHRRALARRRRPAPSSG